MSALMISRSCWATAAKNGPSAYCVWIVDRNELHTGIHQCRDECEVPGKTIKLGNDELGLLFFASRKRLLRFNSVIALAAFDLGEVSDEGPPASIQVVHDRLPLIG